MVTYHKIDAPFMRDTKGKIQIGQWCRPEFEFLANNEWEFTEKVDGTNIRIHVEWDEKLCILVYSYGGRTDNAQIPPALTDALNRVVTKVNDKLTKVMLERNISSLVIFGEGYGPKINGGGKYIEEPSFVVFDIRVGDVWLTRESVNDLCDKAGLDMVPVVGVGSLYDGFELVKNGLQSDWGDFEAEGIVAVPTVPLFNRMGNRIITKIKSKDFR